jgi:hypothetical protein
MASSSAFDDNRFAGASADVTGTTVANLNSPEVRFMKPLVIAAVLVALVAPFALAAPGDPRVVAGTLVWPPVVGPEPFAVVRGHDGRFYYADPALLGPRDRTMLRSGDRVAVTGAEGARPAIEDSLQPSALPPTLEPSQRTASPEVERLDGTVGSISSRRMVPRTGDGRLRSIVLTGVSGSAVATLKRGDRVTVFGSRAGSGDLAAVALVYSGSG